MQKTIGIIGSGMIGKQVAKLALNAGYKVAICNSRAPETLAEFITSLKGDIRALNLEGVANFTDMLVVAIPFEAYTKLPVKLLAGKIVINTMNYYPQRDGVMQEVRTDVITTSELVQRHLVNSRVVRALNNVDFVRLLSLARAEGSKERSALPVAADDESAKAAVVKFLDDIGYDAVDMGALKDSWRSEPTTPVYVSPYWGVDKNKPLTSEQIEGFMSAPGCVTDKDEVRRLLAAAIRHDKMFGVLGQYDTRSKRK